MTGPRQFIALENKTNLALFPPVMNFAVSLYIYQCELDTLITMATITLSPHHSTCIHKMTRVPFTGLHHLPKNWGKSNHTCQIIEIDIIRSNLKISN